jgi:hypothetical protein
MSEAINLANQAIDEEFAGESALTRRRMVGGAAAVLGSFGLLGAADAMGTHRRVHGGPNTPENIINIAATAEVLATIVNTVGLERVPLDDTTRQNIRAAAREELIHYNVLTSDAIGAKPATKRIWVPDEVFASRENFLTTLVVGDQIFCNAYLLGTTVFARPGGNANARLARIAAEFMGVEAVHRALALQSLGRLGNDRVFVRFAHREEAPGLPTTGSPGFYDITDAVSQLEGAGFGFGTEGSKAGRFYEFDDVSRRTPEAPVNTRTPL